MEFTMEGHSLLPTQCTMLTKLIQTLMNAIPIASLYKTSAVQTCVQIIFQRKYWHDLVYVLLEYVLLEYVRISVLLLYSIKV